MIKKLAIITGGAGYLGTTIAKRLALNNYIPLLLDYNLVALNESMLQLKKSSCFCLAEEIDITNFVKLQQTITEYSNKFGYPKVLVNAIGWSPKHDGSKPSSIEISCNEWQKVLDINLTSVFNSIKAVLPLMIKGGGGRIVNISSTAGISGSPTAGAHYCAAKAGLIGLTKALASEFAPQNILINAVAPGKFINPKWSDTQSSLDKYIESIPLKRLAKVDEISEIVVFMASEQNSYMTGKVIVVDGGRLLI